LPDINFYFFIRMKKFSALLLLLTLLHTVECFSQTDNTHFCESTKFEAADSNKLYLGIRNINIFRNNEFFNNIDEGYTTFGSLVNPTLKYYPTSKIKIEAGINLVSFYGTDKVDIIKPIFRAHLKLNKNFDFIMGSLYGTANHNFIEPLFRQEHLMNKNVESGMQILYNSRFLYSDLYINWEKYIFRTQKSEREVFTVGWSSEVKALPDDSRLKINFPIQLLVAHIGGQIDTLPVPIESISNFAGGIDIGYKLDGIIKEVGFKTYFARFKDISGEKRLKFKKGYAFYPFFYTKTKFLNLYGGYWNAHDFIAPRGEPIFSSVSYINEEFVFRHRNLMVLKAELIYPFAKGLTVGARYESYYNLDEKQNDFSYGAFINFNRDFFLKTIKLFK